MSMMVGSMGVIACEGDRWTVTIWVDGDGRRNGEGRRNGCGDDGGGSGCVAVAAEEDDGVDDGGGRDGGGGGGLDDLADSRGRFDLADGDGGCVDLAVGNSSTSVLRAVSVSLSSSELSTSSWSSSPAGNDLSCSESSSSSSPPPAGDGLLNRFEWPVW